ncbi:unnamed protein product [marine sediment metagenome]|uniref:Uncharacterized protein n=1 Tax=marine sediment metagenome TaxID=412755 RepID=X1JYB4_9ZZZZ
MSFTIHTGIEDVMDNDQLITDLTERVEAIMAQREEEEVDMDMDELRQELLRQVEMSREAPVKKRPYFEVIMDQVKAIQARYPKRLLCGSVALMLYGVIEKRSGGDIDFVAYEKKIIPNEHLSLQCRSPYKHCLFLGSYVKKGITIDGIRLQDLGQIIFWKRTYGRKKDIKDLKKYLDNQFIKEDEFIIKE